MVLEKTLESLLDSKEVKPVNPKENQSIIFIGRTDAEAETPILWLPDAKEWCLGKDPDAGKDWRQEEKGMTEDEMIGWHHQLNEHEFEQGMGVGDGQESLACCSPWGHKESDMTERLNWTETMRDHGSVKQSGPRGLSIFSRREAATGLWNCWRDLLVSSEASLSPGHLQELNASLEHLSLSSKYAPLLRGKPIMADFLLPGDSLPDHSHQKYPFPPPLLVL